MTNPTPKAVLRRLIRDNPNAPDDWICEQFCRKAEADGHIRYLIYRYWLYVQFDRAVDQVERQNEARAKWQKGSPQS